MNEELTLAEIAIIENDIPSDWIHYTESGWQHIDGRDIEVTWYHLTDGSMVEMSGANWSAYDDQGEYIQPQQEEDSHE